MTSKFTLTLIKPICWHGDQTLQSPSPSWRSPDQPGQKSSRLGEPASSAPSAADHGGGGAQAPRGWEEDSEAPESAHSAVALLTFASGAVSGGVWGAPRTQCSPLLLDQVGGREIGREGQGGGRHRTAGWHRKPSLPRVRRPGAPAGPDGVLLGELRRNLQKQQIRSAFGHKLTMPATSKLLFKINCFAKGKKVGRGNPPSLPRAELLRVNAQPLREGGGFEGRRVTWVSRLTATGAETVGQEQMSHRAHCSDRVEGGPQQKPHRCKQPRVESRSPRRAKTVASRVAVELEMSSLAVHSKEVQPLSLGQSRPDLGGGKKTKPHVCRKVLFPMQSDITLASDGEETARRYLPVALPIKAGQQNTHTKVSTEHNKECLINISKYKFSLVISGLTNILKNVNNMRIFGEAAEKNLYLSQLIILDTLEKCLAGQPKDCMRLDETMLVKQLLPEICHFIHTYREGNQHAAELRSSASGVLFSLSCNNFNAVFSRISTRLQELTVCSEDNVDVHDIELIQYINVDCSKLKRLLQETVFKFKALKKPAQLSVINSLEKLQTQGPHTGGNKEVQADSRDPPPSSHASSTDWKKGGPWEAAGVAERRENPGRPAFWNWVENYPDEFTMLYQRPQTDMADCAEKLFDLVDSFAESAKRKAAVWPLQIILLVLCPEITQDISKDVVEENRVNKKLFLDNLRKALTGHGGSKQLTESAAIACVKLCKASTYINWEDHSVIFLLVQSMVVDLKALLFNPGKPFSRGAGSQSADIDLMIDCFVSCFRINPHNNQHFKVCLASTSPPTFHFVLVNSLHRIITNSPLDWWPKIDAVYCYSGELRTMFLETLNRVMQVCSSHAPLRLTTSLTFKEKMTSLKFKEKTADLDTRSYKYLLLAVVKLIHADPKLMLHNPGKQGQEIQSSTAELITGLVQLVPPANMAEIAQEAMEALLVLHQPETIELWNPDAPIETFWDISSQVLFFICKKLIGHQMINSTEILKWLREILICRNKFLLKNKENATLGSGIPICRQAQTKLEVCLYMFLWSPDIEAVLVAMSCFRHLCEEADIRCGVDEVPVQSILPNYNTFIEFASVSNMMSTGRAALQKRVMALLRRIEHPTAGNKEAWEDTYAKWDQATKLILNYPKTKIEDGQVTESLHKTIVKRRMSHVSGGGSIDLSDTDSLQEWINMTGFLCALGGVCLQHRSTPGLATYSPPMGPLNERKGSMISMGSSEGNVETPLSKFLDRLLSLMVCNHEKVGLQIRTNIKDLVGLELSPALYPMLFNKLKNSISRFFDAQGPVPINDTNTQFVEQTIAIMKNLLDNHTEGSSEHLGQASIETMMLNLVRYVRILGNMVHAIQIKTKLCQLVEVMMERRDDLSFCQEMKFRNKMVEYLTDWVMGISNQAADEDVKCLTRDLDQASMEAVVSLLAGLPLQPEEGDGVELMEAKSQLFLK
ncbi:NF1 protein, partial [Atractosteus spatula]|nr:NF1 protein [Atractosteus spatula]